MKHFTIILLMGLFPLYTAAQTVHEHTVGSGETLQSIASKYGVSITELRSVNTGLGEYVFPGMMLKIPTKSQQHRESTQEVIPEDNLKDIIYLKDGSELVAKILTVERDAIIFEQYDTDDPFTIDKSEISTIHFEDGRVTNLDSRGKKNNSVSRKSSTNKR